MVVAASGILVPAAQVQDRGQRRAARPRGDPGARHRPAGGPQRGRRARLYGLRRRRPRAHAVHRPQGARVPARARSSRLRRGDPARLQSRGTARQQVQGADQDPLHEKTLETLKGEIEAEFEARDRTTLDLPPQEVARVAAFFAAACARAEEGGQRPGRAAKGQGRPVRELPRRQRRRRTRRRAMSWSRCP